MNGNGRQKVGNVFQLWTPLSETREKRILLGPNVRSNFASKMTFAKGLADPGWQPAVDIVECADEFII